MIRASVIAFVAFALLLITFAPVSSAQQLLSGTGRLLPDAALTSANERFELHAVLGAAQLAGKANSSVVLGRYQSTAQLQATNASSTACGPAPNAIFANGFEN